MPGDLLVCAACWRLVPVRLKRRMGGIAVQIEDARKVVAAAKTLVAALRAGGILPRGALA